MPGALTIVDVVGSYRQTWTTGAVTTIAAGTGTAGQLFSKRWVAAATGLSYMLRSLEVEFITTTAFGTPQEVGFDVFKATGYSASPTAGTAIAISTNAKKRTSMPSSNFATNGDIRIATASALTAGTLTLDGEAIARGSLWSGAIGAQLLPRYHDFTTCEPGGIILVNNEGLIIRNTILMGATGVGKWHFTLEWDEVITRN